MGGIAEPEVPDEVKWEEEEITEVSSLREQMRASLAEVRKMLAGVKTEADGLRRAIAAQDNGRVRCSFVPPELPAAADES